MPNTDTPRFELPCVIFAGGKSSRMGRDKAQLPFGGAATLAEYQYMRLSPMFASTYLSVKTASAFPGGMCLITDDPAMGEFAPTAGFVAAFRTLESERFFALSVDTPFVGTDVISALIKADRRGVDAVIARTPRGMHPLCGIYHRRLLPRFESMAASGDHALGNMLKTCDTVFVDFEDEACFANLNHPHEYAEALEKIKQSSEQEGKC